MHVGPVPIGAATPTWYQVNVGVTAGPFGVQRHESLVAVHAVEFRPGTATATVPAALCTASTAVPPEHCRQAGLFCMWFSMMLVDSYITM